MSTKSGKQPQKQPGGPNAGMVEMVLDEPVAVPVRYVVKRAFKYGERRYQPGEEFTPQGGRFDAALLTHHCTRMVNVNGTEVRR